MPEKPRPTQDQINAKLWSACDTFRGAFDSSEYKNYILVFMFLKYLSDMWKDKLQELHQRFAGDETMIQRKLQRERFILPENCSFDYLFEHRNDVDIGAKIDRVLGLIEHHNRAKLEGVFRNISFNSEKLGQTGERNRRLKNLLTDFASPVLDFRPSILGRKEDIIGNAYMFLIEKFASGGGKKGGEFYTPHEVSELLALLLSPKAASRICDPACGSGSLLITVAEHVTDEQGGPSRNFSLYGQDSNGDTWALAKLNMFLHNMDAAHIEWGDTINSPRLLEGDKLMKFDIVVANPPFSLDKWGFEEAAADRFKRFKRGVPPRSKGDYAFILHMIETTEPDGKVGVILPHGVLFRGSAEGKIRRSLVEDNLLDAVIGLPNNLFFGTGIPAAILIFTRTRTHTDVLFIDASREYEEGKKQNRLRTQEIQKIVKTYKAYQSADKYAYRATLNDIRENDYNLNISRYVDTFEQETEVDVKGTLLEIEKLEIELKEVRNRLSNYIRDLGY